MNPVPIALQVVTASKEVILSAGTIGTPHILLNSGIGPSDHLKSVGIKPIVDHPDVGENLSDHPVVVNPFLVNSTDTYDDFERDPARREADIVAWKETGQGPLVNTIATHIGFMRIPDNHTIFETVEDPSAGPTSGHHEFLSFVR